MLAEDEARPRLPWKAFWGKWGFARDDGLPDPEVHPLACHLVDVAVVARVIWDEVFTHAMREHLTMVLGLSTADQAGAWLSFFAGAHDLGKATLAFALQKPRIVGPLREAGLRASQADAERSNGKQPHGLATAVLLPPLLGQLGVDAATRARVGQILGGHHGSIAPPAHHFRIAPQELDDRSANAARRDLVHQLATVTGVATEVLPRSLDVATALLLAGLTTTADWIGSNVAFFPYRARLSTLGYEPRDLGEYARLAREQAKHALHILGWTRHLQPAARRRRDLGGVEGFRALFAKDPLPMQRAVLELAPALASGGLAIIEAPMGEGKTEAALSLAAQWLSEGVARGLYFALPTQATSNQMFGRLREFLARLLPGSGVELQLVHGHAALSAEFALLREAGRLFEASDIHDEENSANGPSPDVVASEWFSFRKRGLLAPYGVGTIDQALLAALITKHVFVRLFGLAGKAVIVDEVHAYDVYTSDLLYQLVRWLGALRSPVILLSATLPVARQRELVSAYAQGSAWANRALETRPYPRVSSLSRDIAQVRQVETSSRGRKTISIRWWTGTADDDATNLEALGVALASALQGGGCAAVICNTVARAQETYRALRPFFGESPATAGSISLRLATDGEPELELLHARLPYDDRQRRELRARRRFGAPDASVSTEDDGESSTAAAAAVSVVRPYRAVLVATQVIEQSLDLDFDLMVTEFAPVDLVLQRSGRLHRHPRPRLAGIAQPTLWVTAPELRDGVPQFDSGTSRVYEPHVLLRSWLALAQPAYERGITIPDDVGPLIESAYGSDDPPADASPALLQAWQATRSAMDERRSRLKREADVRLIPTPQEAEYKPLADFTAGALDEDDPDLHVRFQALTRWGPPTATAIVLYQQAGGALSLDRDGAQRVNPEQKPDSLDTVKALLRRSVPVSTQRLAPMLLREPVPAGWLKSPLLSRCRPLVFDPVSQRGRVGNILVELDEGQGLIIDPD